MISVVLPVRDAMPWLAAQLEALVAQRCDEQWEVVVADNGSRDDSIDVIRSWAARSPLVRLVQASEKAGPSAARNAGVRASAGDRLAFCDADDVVQPGWLAALARGLADDDAVAGAFDLSVLNGLPPDDDPGPAATGQLGFLPAGLAANLAVRRAAFEAVGGFDEEMAVGEDIDLCWRLQLEGYTFAVAGAAVVAKRERVGAGALFGRAFAYGRCGPRLYRRYRGRGARRDVAGSARSWAWLVMALPRLGRRDVRRRWIRAAGVRLGRLVGSVAARVLFP
ncbi:MAG: glycosyltransferase family 2 protein [Acidimicrobiales bacterium]